MRAGDIVRTRGNSYRLLDGMSEGGYGLVVPAVRSRDGVRVAIKFRAELSNAELTDPLAEELGENVAQRFADEVSLMKALPRRPYFPKYYEKGCHKGRPFFVMEWLNPMTGDDWPPKDDKDRMRFVSDLCEAVQDLHEMGYVHYDIKPSNIMHREGDHWILVDFGSAHVKEEETRIENPLTRSMLSDGRRAFPSTPGYADPVWKLHSVSFDIYSIGQVIRDMFGEDVPLVWSKIINKCISRNRELRYENVAALKADVICAEESGRKEMSSFMHRLGMEKVNKQAEMQKMRAKCVSWDAFRGVMRKSVAKDSRFVQGPFELMIDFDYLKNRSVKITTPVVLTREKLVVVKGPGVLMLDLSVTNDEDDEWFGEYHTIVLMDNVTLVNTSPVQPDANTLCYCIGEGCYVNLSGLTRDASIDPDSYRLSNAGYSFIKCNGPDTIEEVIGSISDPLECDMMHPDAEVNRTGVYEKMLGLGEFIQSSGWYNESMGTPGVAVREFRKGFRRIF